MRDFIKLLDNFIKDTTHEINTPISIINTNIELVEESKLDKREKKILRRIKIASRTLETIYKDLKFTTLENGKGLKNVEKFNLKDLIRERVEYFSIIMESKKIKLNLDLQDSFMEADPRLMARVIDNLISNAIKYNRVNGEITIILRQGSLVIKDSGIGIKKENIDKLFTRYSRFNDSEGGFGIGLNIVKQIIDLHKIKIKIDSEENKGTEVKIKW
jgi:two-component system OmpR family sensor kinase